MARDWSEPQSWIQTPLPLESLHLFFEICGLVSSLVTAVVTCVYMHSGGRVCVCACAHVLIHMCMPL